MLLQTFAILCLPREPLVLITLVQQPLHLWVQVSTNLLPAHCTTRKSWETFLHAQVTQTALMFQQQNVETITGLWQEASLPLITGLGEDVQGVITKGQNLHHTSQG